MIIMARLAVQTLTRALDVFWQAMGVIVARSSVSGAQGKLLSRTLAMDRPGRVHKAASCGQWTGFHPGVSSLNTVRNAACSPAAAGKQRGDGACGAGLR
jgi:hypothetical protein